MNSRLRKYDLSSLSSYGPDCATGIEVPELRELMIAERDLKHGFGEDDGTTFSDWPIALHVPDTYEAGYAYPLLIWLHADRGHEGDLEYVMPSISDRNYMGLAFRGNCRALNWPLSGHRWSMNMEESRFFEEVLYHTVVRLRRSYHIHSERIVIGGSGSGATLALQTLLRRPEWFSGSVMLGGRMPALERPLLKYRELRGKRVLQIADRSDPTLRADESRGLRRLLYTAGMDVDVSVSEANVPCEETLRCVDHWMMAGIRQCSVTV